MNVKHDEEKDAIKSALKNTAKESVKKEIKKTSFEKERQALEAEIQYMLLEEFGKSKDEEDFEL